MILPWKENDCWKMAMNDDCFVKGIMVPAAEFLSKNLLGRFE